MTSRKRNSHDKNAIYKVFVWRESGRLPLENFKIRLEVRDWEIIGEYTEEAKKWLFGLIKKKKKVILTCRR